MEIQGRKTLLILKTTNNFQRAGLDNAITN